MSEATYENIKDIYIIICLVVVGAITIRATRYRKIGLSDVFGVAILSWSAYVASRTGDSLLGFFFTDSTLFVSIVEVRPELNLYHDWLITVPLIFISYAVFKHVETEHESGGNLLEFALLGATSFIIIALALDADNGEPLSEQMGLIGLAVLPFGLWAFLIARVLMDPQRYFVSMFERFTVFFILLYPVLWALAGYTVIDESAYSGLLDEIGFSFWDYQSLLIGLSFVCKIGLVLYHSKLLESNA